MACSRRYAAVVVAIAAGCGTHRDSVNPGLARDGGPREPTDGGPSGSTALWVDAPWREVHRVADPLIDLHGSGAVVWAAGFEAITRNQDGRWIDLPLMEADVVNGLWSHQGTLWAAGYRIGVADSPLILRVDDTIIERETVPGRGQLFAIWGASADEVWGVGARDTVLRRAGGSWSEASHPVQAMFTDVRGTGARDVWAVGCVMDESNTCTRSVTMRWDGIAWADVPNPGTGLLGVVWPFGADDAWAAGNGVTLRWDGVAWLEAPSPFAGGVADLFGTRSDDLWATGSLGQLAHWDGRTWRTIALPTSAPVNAVWGSPAGGMWVTSSMGAVLHAGP